MENKDIEQLLQESADEVKVKDFSERWSGISERIRSAQNVKVKDAASETVLATSSNVTVSNNSLRKKIIYSLSAVFLLIAICLAIVLPLTLKKNYPIKFFDLYGLRSVPVTENEFYNNIEDVDLKIFDTDKFEVNSYSLFYAENNLLVGGRFEISDESEGLYAVVVFYNSTVKSSFETGADYNTCTINGFRIEYKTQPDADEVYSTKALAVGTNICYEFECLSLDENIETFFEKIFG